MRPPVIHSSLATESCDVITHLGNVDSDFALFVVGYPTRLAQTDRVNPMKR